jgi:uncharacterized membrane protein YfcA
MRTLFEALKLAAVAQANWEREVAASIFKSKRRLALLGLLVLPILVVAVVHAAPLPDVLGGKETYTPVYFTHKIFVASILVGLCAGLITGCIGAGGGFIITPALMSVGVKGILAVGTDLFHIFAKAIMGTAVHKKLGNVSVKLAIAFLVGSGVGATLGGGINRALYRADPNLSDTFINIVYVVLLGFLGIYAMSDYLKLRKGPASVGAHVGDSAHGREAASGKKGIVATLQGMKIPPLITFDEDLVPGGKRIPALFVAICGAVVGVAAAIMGVGGGFLTFPIFVYVLGVSSFTTVGTDILQIIFTAGWACISQYAIYGFIFYTLAMGMLVGSLLGIQVGALTTRVVKGIHIRGFYAITILAGFINRLFALPAKLAEMKIVAIPKSVTGVLDTVGFYVFFLVVGLFAVWVLREFFGNIGKLRGEAAGPAPSTAKPAEEV